MNNATGHRKLIIISQALVVALIALMSTLAFASPIQKGDSWSASLGYELDIGAARDPGDRDGAMAGSALGPSVGAQWWYRDWLAVEGSFLYQSADGLATHDYNNTAWRLGTGIRLAYPAMVTPHLSLGLAYDSFRSEWALPSQDGSSSGAGVDQLSGLASTSEVGLSIAYDRWALSVHLGYVLYLSAQQESTVDSWVDGSGTITEENHTDWVNNDVMISNINLGLRLSYSF